jgi:hypothetical protein
MNRAQRRAQAAQRRREERRAKSLTLATQVLTDIAKRDNAVSGGTLIMPSGETLYLDAQALKDGGKA